MCRYMNRVQGAEQIAAREYGVYGNEGLRKEFLSVVGQA